MSTANPISEDARKDPDVLQSEIDATRADLDRTLDALQARLSPGQLLDQALGLVREHGGEMARNLGTSVKQNPVPMMLTGIGLVWLMASQRSSAEEIELEVEREDDDFSASAEDVLETSSSPEEIVEGSESEGLTEKAKGKMSAARERVAGAASSLSERMGHAREGTRERMRRARRGTRQGMVRAREGTRHQVERAREGFTYMLHEQPLLLGALGIALGAAIGAALPSTRREDELLGETRDRALEKAKQVGAEQYEKAKEVVTEATGQRRSPPELEGGPGPRMAPPSAQPPPPMPPEPPMPPPRMRPQ